MTTADLQMSRLRCRNGAFYYRAKLPSDVRLIVGKSELAYSLGTSDHETAEALCLELSASQLRLCRVLRQAGRTMTQEQIDQLITHYMESFKANREQDAIAFGKVTPEFVQQRRDNLVADLHDAETALAENNLEGVMLLARDLLWETGTTVDTNSDVFRRLCFRLLNAQVDVLRDDAKRMLPQRIAGQSFSTRNEQPNVIPPSPQATGPKLSELISAYFEFRRTDSPFTRAKTKADVERSLATMLDLMGDQNFNNVRNRDAQDYASKLAGMPVDWRKTYAGKTPSEVCELAKGYEGARAQPATVKKELNLVKPFWRWACDREERALNPMDAVSVIKVGKAKSKRTTFTESDLQRIAVEVAAMERPYPARFWIITFLAYTGARLEEISQLRTSDVIEKDGIRCIRITEEAGDLKGEASERIVPIHSAILAKGFLSYVSSRAQTERLFFDGDKPSEVRGWGAPVSQWFGRMTKALALENRAKKQLHSLRHNVIDRLRIAGIDPTLRREIVGHSPGDVEDGTYGDSEGLPVKMKQQAVEAIKMPF